MSKGLRGSTIMFDDDNGVTLTGRMSLNSDGINRALVVVQDFDRRVADRLLFRRPAAVSALHIVIQSMRQCHDEIVSVPLTSLPCERCLGAGGWYTDEGNWRDCTECVP